MLQSNREIPTNHRHHRRPPPRPLGFRLPPAGRATDPAPGPPSTDWIADDLERAIALGRATHRPVFVDLWATWCHTCNSMRTFLVDAARSVEVAHHGALPAGDPLAFQIAALDHAGRFRDCVTLGIRSMNETGSASTAVDFAADATTCAEKLDPKDEQVSRVRTLALERILLLARDRTAPLSDDDRGDALGLATEILETLGRHEEATATANERLSLVEAAASKAPTPSIASTYDAARLDALLFLDRSAEAVAFLEARVRGFPDDFNAAHRLAKAELAAKNPEGALRAVERSIALAYGPRRGLIMGLWAVILVALGRSAEARRAVVEQLEYYRALPAGERRPALEQKAADRLSRMP